MKYYIYALLFLTLSISCNQVKEEKTENTVEEYTEENQSSGKMSISKPQFESSEMQLGQLTKQNFPTEIKTTGVIDVPPQNKEVISSFFGGYINKSSLLIGDKVRKGQALVTIENPEFVEIQQEYLEVAEQLTFLKSEFERQKILFEEKITSQKNYLKSQSEYRTKLAMYNGLRKKLQMLHINPLKVEQGNITTSITLYSSINGSITQVNVSKGTYISPADVIMEIVNKDHIHLELVVFEKDVLAIKEGQKISFSIPEASDKKYKAEVHLVGTAIDQETRTIKVHGHLEDDENHNFAIGMFVKAAIEISSKENLALPSQAIVDRDGENVLLILKTQNKNEYVFIEKVVTIGNTYNNFTEITSKNIEVTDQVLIKGAFDLVNEEGGGGHSH